MTQKRDLKSPASLSWIVGDHILHKVWHYPLHFRTLIFYECSCCPWACNEEQHAREQVHWADSSADTQIYEGSLQSDSAQI